MTWIKQETTSTGGGSSVTRASVNGRLTVDGQDITVYDDTDIRTSLGVPKISPDTVSQMSIYFEGTNASQPFFMPGIYFDLSSLSSLIGTSVTVTMSFTPDFSVNPTAITRLDDWYDPGGGRTGTSGNIVSGTPFTATRTFTLTKSILTAQPIFQSGVTGGNYKITLNNFQVTLNGTSILGYMYDAGINGSYQPTMTTAKITKTKSYTPGALNSRWAGKRWGVLGDSIEAGFNGIGPTQTWPNKVANILNVLHMSNLAVGGRTVAINDSSPTNHTNNLVNDAQRPYMDYDLLTIALGTNDYGNSTPMGTIGSKTDATASFNQSTFYGGFRYSLDTIIAAYPNTHIVLIQPFYRTGSDAVNSVGLTLDDYRTAITNIGKMYNLPVCDSRFGINHKNATNLLFDGLHPNQDGHNRISDYISGFLSSI